MKTLKTNIFLLFLLQLVVLTSCVKNDDFEIPNLNIEEPLIDGEVIDIFALRGMLTQSTQPVVTFSGTNTYISGYVVSSDEGGNFFKQLIVQNDFENPTAGVKVLVDVSPLYVSYEVGRKVYIKLDGLTLGISNGVLALGYRSGNNVARIPFAERNSYIIRSSEVEEIIPLPVKMEKFGKHLTNLFIRLDSVQFNRNAVLGPNPKTFAAEPEDQFDGERVLESCTSNSSTILSTSTFSSFKGLRLPAGSGSIEGILTRDFYDAFFTIYINTPADIHFNSSQRCDPEAFQCEGPSGGPDILFSENFESITNMNQLTGWENINTAATNPRFVLGSFNNNKYAQISGFATNQPHIDAWLVTPPIDFDASSLQELEFDLEAAYDNGKILSVLITENYTGAVTTTHWEILDAEIPKGPSNGFGGFQPIGPINISCFSGEVRIAFRYQGSDPYATTRYHIDNIRITGVED